MNLDHFHVLVFPVVPVQFNPTVYTATEGNGTTVTVTLEALNDHNFPFNITVNTMDGTAERKLITSSSLFYTVPLSDNLLYARWIGLWWSSNDHSDVPS